MKDGGILFLDRASVAENTYKMLGMYEQVEAQHKETSKHRVQKDKEDVQSLCDLLYINICNPFDCSDVYDGHLINLATGLVLPDSDADNLIAAHSIGQLLMQNFIEERLIQKSVPFFDSLHKPKINTFQTLSKPLLFGEERKPEKCNSGILPRLLVASQTRNIDLKNILCYELTAVPVSLAKPDGSLNRGTKSVLLKELEKLEKGIPNLPHIDDLDVAYIIDGMVMIHSMKSKAKVFGEFKEDVFLKLLNLFKLSNVTRVDIIFDIYDTSQNTIKYGEHTLRKKRKMAREIKIINESTRFPHGQDFEEYLKNPQNKSNLTLFLGQSLQKVTQQKIKFGQKSSA